MRLRVAFTGGGTGGHVYPALALDDALRAQFAPGAYEPHFFGNRHGLEARLVTAMPLTFVPSAPLQRRASLGALRTVVANAAGVVVALAALARFRPHALVATGGYVCFPVVVAARILRALRVVRCGIALLEPNAVPGLTNRLTAPLVDEVWVAYDAARAAFGAKARALGTPVRASVARKRDRAAARRALGLDPEGVVIVVMGGSQGARSINHAATALVTRRTLPPSWQVLLVSGERDVETFRAALGETATGNRARIVAYLDDPGAAYAAADVVVARAGASTLAELAVTGTPSVLIPYPHAAEAHQERNARLFAEASAAVVLDDAGLDGDRLWWTLNEIVEPYRLGAMRAAARSLAPPDAAAAAVERIESLVASHAGARVAGGAGANDEHP